MLNNFNFRLYNTIAELEYKGNIEAVKLLKIYGDYVNKNKYIDIYHFFDLNEISIIEDAFY